MFDQCELFKTSPEESKWISEVIGDINYGLDNDKKSLEILAVYKIVLWFTYSTVLSYMLINKSTGKLQDRLFFYKDGQRKLNKLKKCTDICTINVFEFSNISESAWCDLLDEIGMNEKSISSMRSFIEKRHAIAHATGATSDLIRDGLVGLGETLIQELGIIRNGFIWKGDIEIDIQNQDDVKNAIDNYCLMYRIGRIDSKIMQTKFLEKIPAEIHSIATPEINSFFYTE